MNVICDNEIWKISVQIINNAYNQLSVAKFGTKNMYIWSNKYYLNIFQPKLECKVLSIFPWKKTF